MKKQNYKITKTALLALMAMGLAPRAQAVTDGFYSGSVSTQGKISDVRVFIHTEIANNGPEKGMTANFGLILFNGADKKSHGALFKIEELPDGTQSWIHYYQGQGRFLKTNADQSATLKGVLKKGSLHLVAAEGAQLCQSTMREINAERSDSEEWLPLSDKGIEFTSGDNSSHGTLTADQLIDASLVFADASHEGTFALNKVSSHLATLRPEVLDQDSISGKSLSRDMVGVVALIERSRFPWRSWLELSVIELLPINQETCSNPVTTLEE